MPNAEQVPVTQKDRDFVADLICELGEADAFEVEEVRTGLADATAWVQRAARHRTEQSEQPRPSQEPVAWRYEFRSSNFGKGEVWRENVSSVHPSKVTFPVRNIEPLYPFTASEQPASIFDLLEQVIEGAPEGSVAWELRGGISRNTNGIDFDYLVPKLRAALQTPEPRGDVVEAATAEWKDFHGPLPEWGDPMRCVFESGIQYAVELLAKVLKVEEYEICDGTEEFDGDLGGTMLNIVCKALPKDADGDHMHPSDVAATLTQPDTTTKEEPRTDAAGMRELLERIAGKIGQLYECDNLASVIAIAEETKRLFDCAGMTNDGDGYSFDQALGEQQP